MEDTTTSYTVIRLLSTTENVEKMTRNLILYQLGVGDILGTRPLSPSMPSAVGRELGAAIERGVLDALSELTTLGPSDIGTITIEEAISIPGYVIIPRTPSGPYDACLLQPQDLDRGK